MENGEREDNGGQLARARDCNLGIVRKMGILPALKLAQRQYRATRARTESIYLPIEGDEVEGLMM